jgi:hypothetical protein
MPILVTGNTYAANDQVTSTNLNAAVNSATFASGAVDDVSTQLSSGSIIVKDSGISPQKLDSTASYTVGSLTATSTVTTNSLTLHQPTSKRYIRLTSYATSGITSAGIIVDIMQADLLKLVPETGYTTSGTICPEPFCCKQCPHPAGWKLHVYGCWSGCWRGEHLCS